MDLDEGSTKCQRAMEADGVDRASPVFSADEDVHNPSVDGLGTGWGIGVSTVVDRASPVFCADEDVHNPSVDGLGGNQKRGCSSGRKPPLLRVGTSRESG